MGFESDEEYIEYLEAVIDHLLSFEDIFLGIAQIKTRFDEEYFNKGE